jgi:hypothetical protein
MDKLIRVALATKFKEEDLENILFIANATGNAPIACEMLLGVFEHPVVPEFAFDSDNRKNRELTNYSVFSDTVNFTYNQVSTKQAWFMKDELEPTEENMVSSEYYSEEAWKESGKYNSEKHFKEWCEKKTYFRKVSERKSNGSCTLGQWLEWFDKGSMELKNEFALAV